MKEIGRNDPCPCGSGKKYKKCCLAAERPAAVAHFGSAVRRALDWLAELHSRAVEAELAEIHAQFDERIGTAADNLPDYVFDSLDAAAKERLLGDAELATEVALCTAWQLLSGSGGPVLAAEEREVLSELASRPLRLYTVADVHPGSGLRLVDVLSAESLEVEERSASRQLEPGDVLITRVLRRGHAATLSGVVLPFPRPELQPLREMLRRRERQAQKLPPAEGRRRMGEILVDAWLQMVVRRSQPPTLVDAGSGETIVLTTDHYRVRDWKGLAAALAAQPDIEDNAAEGWTRVDREAAGRVLCTLQPGREDRLEVFARTQGLADAARDWLQSVAGELVSFRAREVLDPREAVQRREKAGGSRETATARQPIQLSAAEQQALHEQLYAGWAEKPIPALGNKTPRQALRSKLGRERLVALLLSYEHQEREQARSAGRPPVDYGFLWRAVGLEPGP